ncbi:hypothetical protein AVEN_238854-1 [Araneus ventricosus]|uniref:Uncharacterized protein n=1 Tax=Araneus ventricosus TaxID=182803 RepID=A0A4Y2EPK9_ARAVE|nr:hypothetical protein AVEN_238854-1 [Araneus ventricosus]
MAFRSVHTPLFKLHSRSENTKFFFIAKTAAPNWRARAAAASTSACHFYPRIDRPVVCDNIAQVCHSTSFGEQDHGSSVSKTSLQRVAEFMMDFKFRAIVLQLSECKYYEKLDR